MKIKLITILFLILLTFAILVAMFLFASHKKKETPIAEKGLLDLSQWDFNEQGKVPLDGEWEFYPNLVLEPVDFVKSQHNEKKPQMVSVPDISWAKYDLVDHSMNALGKATFRLKIININEENQIFGIRTSGIFRPNKLFVNGELIGSSGDSNDYSSSIESESYNRYFTIKTGMNEIILQVANYNFPIIAGGLFTSQYFGTQQQISQSRDLSVMNDWIAISIFLIMGLYFFGLYSQRKKDNSLLYFSIYCLTNAAFNALHGEGVAWHMVFPNTPDWVMLRFLFGSSMVSSLSLILYIHTAFKHLSSKKFMWFLVAIGFTIMLYELLFLQYTPLWVISITTFFRLFLMLYALYVMILAFFNKTEGSVYLIVGVLAMSLHMIKTSIAKFIRVDSFFTQIPFEPFVLLLMFALLMSLRFSNAFKRNEQLSQELLKVDQVKDEFLAKTSHELKTPLHGIMNISSFLIDEGKGKIPKEYNESLSLIHDSSIKLSNLVNDLIDVTCLKNGELRLYTNTVDIKVTAQIVCDVLTFETEGKPIQLMNNINESRFVVADENRLRQILYNLIDNAIKHTENGKITVSSKKVDDKVYVYIEDTGIGIPEDKQEKIFGYFEQLDKLSHQGEYQSMGLGLYISRQLIDKMKGEIWVDWSEVGKGTRIAFTLPKAEYSRQKASDDSYKESHIPIDFINMPEHDFDRVREHDKTILIVDDESINIKVLVHFLSRYGYNLITAFSAKEALSKMGKYNKIDLAILDVMMPIMSGIDLCRVIRKTHSMSELPILFATVMDRPEDIELCFNVGGNDYITKPFDTNTILARIQTLLSMKTSMEESFHHEMAFLQAQIKPHFLYNAMSNIISYCYTDGQKAAYLLNKLSQYLRMIYSSDQTSMFVPLHKEVDLIKAYVEIEKARFDQFNFSCYMEESLKNYVVPSLCIQPFVENAIRHGLFEKEGEGYVSLTIYEKNERIEVVIEDNGVGMSEDILEQFAQGEIDNAGIGMTNIKKRLESISGSFIDINSVKDEGSKVTLRLPKAM
ncbi:ATP-binding protein [Chengkuizengella marina]|nr:ATP-binding protein [Chengkuizengella marina]